MQHDARMFNKEEAFQKISELTERFEDQIATYKKPDYFSLAS